MVSIVGNFHCKNEKCKFAVVVEVGTVQHTYLPGYIENRNVRTQKLYLNVHSWYKNNDTYYCINGGVISQVYKLCTFFKLLGYKYVFKISFPRTYLLAYITQTDGIIILPRTNPLILLYLKSKSEEEILAIEGFKCVKK